MSLAGHLCEHWMGFVYSQDVRIQIKNLIRQIQIKTTFFQNKNV